MIGATCVNTGVSLGACQPMFMMESEMATTTMRCLAFVSMLLTKEPRTCKSVASEPGGDCISKTEWKLRVDTHCIVAEATDLLFELALLSLRLHVLLIGRRLGAKRHKSMAIVGRVPHGRHCPLHTYITFTSTTGRRMHDSARHDATLWS